MEVNSEVQVIFDEDGRCYVYLVDLQGQDADRDTAKWAEWFNEELRYLLPDGFIECYADYDHTRCVVIYGAERMVTAEEFEEFIDAAYEEYRELMEHGLDNEFVDPEAAADEVAIDELIHEMDMTHDDAADAIDFYEPLAEVSLREALKPIYGDTYAIRNKWVRAVARSLLHFMVLGLSSVEAGEAAAALWMFNHGLNADHE